MQPAATSFTVLSCALTVLLEGCITDAAGAGKLKRPHLQYQWWHNEVWHTPCQLKPSLPGQRCSKLWVAALEFRRVYFLWGSKRGASLFDLFAETNTLVSESHENCQQLLVLIIHVFLIMFMCFCCICSFCIFDEIIKMHIFIETGGSELLGRPMDI